MNPIKVWPTWGLSPYQLFKSFPTPTARNQFQLWIGILSTLYKGLSEKFQLWVFCSIAEFYDGCKMLMRMMTGRQAPSSLAAITALENIKLFRFKGFLLQVSGPRARPVTAALLSVILIMNTGLWLVSESVLGSWLAAQWHEYQWHNFNDLTSSSQLPYLLSTKLSE